MTTRISAIIAQHIATQTRIIIPEVGTLIRRKESGEIVFMEMLKKSDGALTSLVVNTLDVSPSKANELIGNYTAAIKHQLATNKKFILDGVGVLLARRDGGVDFSFNPFAQSLPEVEHGVEILEEEPFVPKAPATPKVATPEAPKTTAPEAPKAVVSEAPKVAATPRPAPRPAMEPAPAPAPKVIYKVEDENEEFEAPKSKIQPRQTRKKLDGITIVAIVALCLALFSLIWGLIPSNDRVEVDVEQVAE